MKKRSLAWIVTAVAVAAALVLGKAQAPISQSSSFYVTDAAGLLSAETEDLLIRNNRTLGSETGARFLVATVKSTGLRSTETYYESLARQWGLGSRDMLLLLVGDQDYYFDYGDDLYDWLGSAYRTLLDTKLEPEFAAGDPDGAVRTFYTAVSDVLMTQSSSGTVDQPVWNDGQQYYEEDSGGSVLLGVLIFVIILAVVLPMSRRRRWVPYGGYRPRPYVPRPGHFYGPRSPVRPGSGHSSSGFGGGRSSGGFGGGGGGRSSGGFGGSGGRRH